MSVGTNIQTINYSNNMQPKVQTNFKAHTAPVQDYPPNTVEINSKKKTGMSTCTKLGISFGSLVLLGLGARFGYKKFLNNIYSKKLKISDLPEKIVFNKATSKEEALKYARETLKINNVSEDLSLDALNYVNKGLTDISNSHKGKFINILGINSMDKDIANRVKGTIGGVCISPAFSKDFAKLSINLDYFKPDNLDTKLKDIYYKQGKIRFDKGKIYKFDNIFVRFDSKYDTLLQKYYQSPKDLSFEEKLRLIESYDYLMNNVHNLKKGLKTGAKGVKSDKVLLGELQSENHFIYHELGHLQDFFNNGMKQHLKSPFMYDINIRRDALNILPTKSHEEFINTQSIQETAGKVSNYAKTSRDEFIAETYARLIEGEKLHEDVMALYKKYNGPMI